MNDGPLVVDERGGFLDLDGTRFGVVELLPPADVDFDAQWAGWDDTGWGFAILMENGAAVSVRWDDGQLSLYLVAPYWSLDPLSPNQDWGELPCHVDNGTITVGDARFARWIQRHLWYECDPAWAAEHIERLSQMPFPDRERVNRTLRRMQVRPVTPRPVAGHATMRR